MKENKDELEFLKNYKASDYERPSITADILLFRINWLNQLQLLLIKRKNYPFKDCWAIPGGFCEMTETLDETAKRELFEETNIKNVYLEQLYTFSNVNRDPRTRVISVAYIGIVSPTVSVKPKALDDACDLGWFDVSMNADEGFQQLHFTNSEKSLKFAYSENKKGKMVQVDNELIHGLAFDHVEIVKMALERMRGKIDYTNLAYQFLPEEFTLNELQNVYEVILGKKLHTPNFRRKIMNQLEATGNVAKIEHYTSKKYKQKEGGK